MMHVAIHDALNAIDRRYQPYAYDGAGAPGASPEAAVAAAARDVLVALFPQLPPDIGPTPGPAVALVEAAYANALASIPSSPAKTQGIHIGQAAAAAILALRYRDGSEATFLDFNYVAGSNPGDFQLIPGFPFAAAPSWGAVTPFVLRASSQYRPKAPYDAAQQEIRGGPQRGEESRPHRQHNADRRADADCPILGRRRAAGVEQDRQDRVRPAGRGSLGERASVGLLNLASADAYIADFENKYFYEFWRPITAIRAADTDGNPDTDADPTWDSLVPTPPAPDYPSGHSGQGGAMSEVLERFFGDGVSFSTTSTTQPGVIRSFTSFSQAAKENANSRIYIGFHFRHATVEGLKLGGKVGQVAFNHYLRPVH